MAKRLPGLRLSLHVVEVEQDRRPRWFGDYSYFKTNSDTLPVAGLSVMQYGRALDCLLREIVFVNLTLGPIYLLKVDVSDRF